MIIKINNGAMEEAVSCATRLAIKRAKSRQSSEVTSDDLLMGLLQAIARFDIVEIGPLTIDLEALEEVLGKGPKDEADKTQIKKVTYSSGVVAIFERAAHIARKDNSPKVELVHLLVAFAHEGNALMTELKYKYGFSSVEWRSALSKWQPLPTEKGHAGSKAGDRRKFQMESGQKQFFSPDEAAEFLGVHTQTIRGYIRAGKLPALRLAGERALRIPRDDLLALLEPYKLEES